MRLTDLLEVGEFGAVPFIGLGVLALGVPYFVPALRQPVAGLLKASAKLFLEAELGADDELTDRVVDASVDTLMDITASGTGEQRKQNVDHELDRFFSRARHGSKRRGFDEADKRRRYHKHLSKMERALKRKREHAGPERRAAFDYALERIDTEHRRISEHPAKHERRPPPPEITLQLEHSGG